MSHTDHYALRKLENNLSKLENNFKSFQEQVHGSWSLN